MSRARALRRRLHSHTFAVPDDPDPPRKYYGFKPTEFDRANAPRPPAPEEESATLAPPSADAVRDTPIDLRELVRQGAASGPVLKGNAPVNRANDVHSILRDNFDRAEAAGLNVVPPPAARKSRRKRDYMISLLVGNAGLLGCIAIMPVFGIAGIIIYNCGLTWVVWGVMDDY